jgi:putative heme-binding domain-containing protein
MALAVRANDRVAVELPAKAEAGLLAERLRTAGGATKIGSEFLAIDWSKEGRTGDAQQGRKLFGALGCIKCHAIAADQAGGGGPSLTDAGRRFTPVALVESILTPDRQVANDYRATRLALADGRSLVGLVVKETPTELEILLPDTTRHAIKTAEIEDRRIAPGSPMPAALVRTPGELRDLLSYLLSEHPLPP